MSFDELMGALLGFALKSLSAEMLRHKWRRIGTEHALQIAKDLDFLMGEALLKFRGELYQVEEGRMHALNNRREVERWRTFLLKAVGRDAAPESFLGL